MTDTSRAATPSAPDRSGEEPALRARDHAALVYFDPDELLRTVVPYLRAGLREGDKVVYVADDHPIEVIADALRSADVDVERETAAGRLVLVSSEDAFFSEGRFDVERALAGVRQLATEAAQDGFARVRFSVEMTYLLADVPGIEGGAEFEARANEEVFAQFPFVCICSFNGAREDSTDVLADVLSTHPLLFSDGIPLINPHYRPFGELAADPDVRARWTRRRREAD